MMNGLSFVRARLSFRFSLSLSYFFFFLYCPQGDCESTINYKTIRNLMRSRCDKRNVLSCADVSLLVRSLLRL